jgi:hypothetical protein
LKKLITFRFDPDLIASAKMAARRENRTLTNFVETLLKKATESSRPEESRQWREDRASAPETTHPLKPEQRLD